MKVKLISMTPNPIDVMWTAARTCYSAGSPIDMWENIYPKNIGLLDDDTEIKEIQEKHWNLVKKVLDSGHQSVAEHVYFTFAIEGISRACSHQLVRHRAGIVFSQQSQRYVEIKEDWDTLFDMYDETRTEEINNNLKNIANKYFVGVTEDNYNEYIQILCSYLYKVKQGMKPEDARNILPNATKTNITMSVNYRELIHLCNLRLCTRAQKEIRDLFKLIKKEVEAVEPRLAEYLRPNCEALGVCTEHQSCRRKPILKEVLGTNKLLVEDDTILSKNDWAQLMEAINNPRVNEKLAEFMKGYNESKASLIIEKEDR